MKGQIGWDDMPATVTTDTFKRIKDFVLGLKEDPGPDRVFTDPDEPAPSAPGDGRRLGVQRRRDDDGGRAPGKLRLRAGAAHLRGRASRILLAPELLNNLAASFVLEARRNPKGLGALDEGRVLKGEYRSPS